MTSRDDEAMTSQADDLPEIPCVDFVTALKEKYADINGITRSGYEIRVVRPRRASQSENKEGEETSDENGFTIPSIVSLNDVNITTAGNLESIRSEAGFVRELDLAKTHIAEWDEIYKLMAAFPNMEFLNLSFNPLHEDCASQVPQCPKLKRLILNGAKANCDVVDKILNSCPGLEELHLSLNAYTTVQFDTSSQPRRNIKIFFFNGNHVTDWRELSKIGAKFPELQSFSLTETAFVELIDENIPELFPNLKCLCLSRCNIASWDDIEKLNSFPKLEEVKVKDITLLTNYEKKVARQLMISHLPRILILNGSRICEKEREDAERATIRYFMEQNEEPKRFEILVAKHGTLHPLIDLDLGADDCRATVKVTHKAKQTRMTIDVEKTTVLMLKKRISLWCGLTLSEFDLAYQMPTQEDCIELEELYKLQLIEPFKKNRKLYELYGLRFVTDWSKVEFQVWDRPSLP